MEILIEAKEYQLCELSFDDNVNGYLYWVKTPLNDPFILNASPDYDLFQLKTFVKTGNNRADVVLFGILSKTDKLHIESIKFDEVNSQIKSPMMGTLIGYKNNLQRLVYAR